MYTSKKKIHKDKDVEPTEFEETVAQVVKAAAILLFYTCIFIFNYLDHWTYLKYCRTYLKCRIFGIMQYLFDLENTNQELKSDLKDLYINSAVYVSYNLLLNLLIRLWIFY